VLVALGVQHAMRMLHIVIGGTVRLYSILRNKYSETCLNRTPYIPETWTNGK